MKTLHLQPNILFIALFLSVSTFIGCGDSEVEGCTNAFAANYNSLATEDCCCEFDVESLVDELEGAYDFKVKNSDFTPGYSLIPLTLLKDPEDKNTLLVNDYWSTDLVGSFEDGEFIIKSEVTEFFGCYTQTKGKILREGTTLKMEVEKRSWGIKEGPSTLPCNISNYADDGELIKN